MGQQEKVATSLAGAVSEGISASLAPVDAELERRYPGDPGTRQPVHTVYVPGEQFDADTIRTWGDKALAMLDEHAPDAASFAAVLGLGDDLAEAVHTRVRAKLEREPVEDLRIDFEDGYKGADEDQDAARAARLVAEAYKNGTAAPYMGIRMKCMEAPVRDRGIRTLDIFLSGLMEAGGLPDGLVLTLPKVTYPEQVTAMVRLLEAFEKAHGLEAGRLGFEIQIETSQSISTSPAGLDLDLEADPAGLQTARLLELLQQPDHRGDLLGVRHLRQRQDEPVGQPAGLHQAGEEDVEGADAAVADRGLHALHADGHVRGRRAVLVRLRDQPGRARRGLVLLGVRVTVLEVDTEVLDGLALKLGRDASYTGPARLSERPSTAASAAGSGACSSSSARAWSPQERTVSAVKASAGT